MFAILRSTTSKQVQLITQPRRLRELPPYVLKQGPWKIVGRGDEARLRLHYRRALAREGWSVRSLRGEEDSMELIEAWRNTAVREGFEHGCALSQISEETGLSVAEVLHREVELNLIPLHAAALLTPLPRIGKRCRFAGPFAL